MNQRLRDCTDSGGFGKQKVFEHPKFVSMFLGMEMIPVQEMKNRSHTKPCSEKGAKSEKATEHVRAVYVLKQVVLSGQ